MSKFKEVSGNGESLKMVFDAPPGSMKPEGFRRFISSLVKKGDSYLTHVSLVFLLGSVGQPFQGAYLEISKNPKYKKLKDAVDEKIIIAEVVNKINRANGKVIKWHCFIWKSR